MILKSILRKCTICFAVFVIPVMVLADTVGLFYDSKVPQIKFAAEDVKKALELKGFMVESLPLTSLNTLYANVKVVLALASDSSVTEILTSQVGAIPANLGEQAYGLRTTISPEKSYWVLGGDENGTMYGGFQIAENINFYGFTGVYNNQETPKILKRGIKLNLPFDVKSPTYFNSNNSTSSRNAIANVWEMSFWTSWFDEMAINRYNVISIWNNHPFTSMIKLPDYPNAAINNVTGYSDIYNDNDKTGVVIKTMTIDEKIDFWRNVMAYAKSRGFSFYLFNWNLFLANAKDQYGMTEGPDGVTNQATITYMRKCMYELLSTYPDLDGFGVTEGENMSQDDEANSLFLGSTFGKGMADFAKDNPQRKLNFIHRWHMADFSLIKKNFAELLSCPNVTFDMSYKYSAAHMYSSTTPDFMSESNINALKTNNIKTWFTVRNDDFYFHNWGDPNYARTYLNNIPGKGDWFTGFYIGSDGFHQTRTFFSKNSSTQGLLEVQRQWYMTMLWGRLSYNPDISDDVFKNYMRIKYPELSSDDLFMAWSKASSGLPKVGEILFGTMKLDFHWYPENCQNTDKGFLTIADFAAATTRTKTNLCSIAGSAAGTCSDKISSYAVADQIENDALDALSLIASISAPANSEPGVAINNIKAMSYLTIYYANKIRGATYSKAGKTMEAINAMGKACCWWMKYSNLMDAMYFGISCQRSSKFATWHQHDASVLREYTNLGGTGNPICGSISYKVSLTVNNETKGSVIGAGLYNPGDIVVITAVPKSGYRFLFWKENNVMVSSDAEFKFTIENDKEIIAYFVESEVCAFPWNDAGITVNKATINKTIGPIDISCASNGVSISMNLEGVGADNSDYCKVYYKVDGGSLIPIVDLKGSFGLRSDSATAIIGNKLEIVIISATSYGDEFYYIRNIKVTGETPVVPTVQISLNVNGCRGSTVTGGGTVNSYDSATVSANPAAGCKFVNWTENGVEQSKNISYTFFSSKDRSLLANFEEIINSYQISLAANGCTGSTADGGGTFNEGDSVILRANPVAGCTFLFWTENGVEQSRDPVYAFTVTQNRELEANFSTAAKGGEIECSEISVYPNPVSDRLYFAGPCHNINRTQIFDLFGKVLSTDFEINEAGSIDLTRFIDGLYIFKIHTSDAVFTTKIIKI